MELPESTIAHLNPEVVLLDGEWVPSKNINYKTEHDGTATKVWFKDHVLSYERKKRKELEEELSGLDIFPTEKEVHVAISFGLSSKKYTEGDVDNKAKTILDAMIGPVYADDMQVKKLWVDKQLTPDEQDWCLLSIKILD